MYSSDSAVVVVVVTFRSVTFSLLRQSSIDYIALLSFKFVMCFLSGESSCIVPVQLFFSKEQF